MVAAGIVVVGVVDTEAVVAADIEVVDIGAAEVGAAGIVVVAVEAVRVALDTGAVVPAVVPVARQPPAHRMDKTVLRLVMKHRRLDMS